MPVTIPESWCITVFSSCMGAFVACQYFFTMNKPVAAFLREAVTRSSSWPQRIWAVLFNMMLAFPVSWLLYDATTPRQFALASASYVAIISGHQTLKAINGTVSRKGE